MALGCGASLIKYLLFAFNLLCTLLSVAVIAIGGILLSNIGDLSLDNDTVQVFPIVLIVVGVASFLISFFGCCGAIRESPCLIYTYSTSLMILLIAHIVLGAIILVQLDDTLQLLKDEMRNLWANRDKEASFWDSVQRGFQCCGLNSASEWGNTLPDSCCPGSGQCLISNAFPRGCTLITNDNLSYYGHILGYVALGSAAVQLIGFVFSCILVNSVRRSNRGYA